MKVENKILFNNYCKEIFDLLNSNDFENAKIKASELLNLFKSDTTFFIKGYVEESEKYYYAKENETLFNYLNIGLKYFDNENYEEALKYFENGYNNTSDPIFKYYIGMCNLYLKNYEEAIDSFNYYNKNSYLKREECYYYLAIAYEKYGSKNKKSKANKLSNEYFKMSKKFGKVKKGHLYTITEVGKNVDFEDDEIKCLIENGKINDVLQIFDECEYERKVTILAFLYKYGFKDTSDKLLKRYRNEIKKECPSELTALENNKQLFIKKAQFGR